MEYQNKTTQKSEGELRVNTINFNVLLEALRSEVQENNRLIQRTHILINGLNTIEKQFGEKESEITAEPQNVIACLYYEISNLRKANVEFEAIVNHLNNTLGY